MQTPITTPRHSVIGNEVHEGSVHCYFVNIVKDKDFKQVIFYLGEIMIHQEFVLQ
ncbi:MAG TPA: hypothetical protein VK616_00090 [Flavitalea sp.]|nr:hypothetical protein [Flavitalea sp.]